MLTAAPNLGSDWISGSRHAQNVIFCMGVPIGEKRTYPKQKSWPEMVGVPRYREE